MKSGKIGLLFLLVLVVLVSNNLILFRNFQTVRDHHASVARTHLILKEIGEIVSSVRELESVGRGYLLEQDPSFLRDLARAKDEVWSHFASLNAATRGKAEQTTALTEIRNLLEERIRLVDSNIDLARAQGTAGVARLNVVLTGKRLMDRLRIRLNSLVSVEEGALAARTAAVTRSSALVTFTLIASGVVNFLLALMAFWLVRRQLEYQARMIDEQRRKGWIQAGLAKVAQITAGQIQPRAVAEKTLDLISEILNVPAGNFFLYSGGRLKRFATCGGQTSEPEAMDVSYGIGESLIGAAAQRGERIQEVREVPDDYFPIASSLGSATPHNLVFVPLRFEERLLGVMELAMFHPLQGRERELLEQIQERVAVSMNSALARERQQELLEETQRQAEELQAQQEELRTSNEELEQQTSALLRSQEKLQTQQEELRQINEELEAQTRTLERQQAIVSERNTELERANQYKSEFLAKMSHELRTPLNSMLILSSLLQENKDGNLSEQQREFASTIHDAGSDLLTLINDILDLAKMEARKLVLRPQTFSIQSLCDQLNLQFGPLFTKKGLDFQVDLDPATPQAMFSDRQRIEQVLRNFTSNALKFTEKGQVRLQVRMAPDQADTLWFSVQDTGVGIPESQKLKIFEAFEQADGSISRKYGGTGLGLTISRELAGLLQGRIFVSSVENQGSTFTLEVPLRIKGVARGQTHGPPTPVPGSSPQPVSPAAVEAPPGPAAPVRGEVERLVAQALGESRGRTVLIVEDDLVFRRAAEDAARAHGFAPISVGDGETALDVLRQHLPSAILLDIKLPGVSGLSVLETVKQTPQWRHIPVHMISALEYQMSAMRLGAMG
ncbi:MAG: ATP-binding protein, partial [Bdellovibrionales bacterium]